MVVDEVLPLTSEVIGKRVLIEGPLVASHGHFWVARSGEDTDLKSPQCGVVVKLPGIRIRISVSALPAPFPCPLFAHVLIVGTIKPSEVQPFGAMVEDVKALTIDEPDQLYCCNVNRPIVTEEMISEITDDDPVASAARIRRLQQFYDFW